MCGYTLTADDDTIVCLLCCASYHTVHSIVSITQPGNWCCSECLSAALPFGCIEEDEEFIACLHDRGCSASDLLLLNDSPRLEIFTDPEENHWLMNNPDLDPDENYYTIKPVSSIYSLPDSLTNVNGGNHHLISMMHINCRSIQSKIPRIESLLASMSIDILAVSETWLDSDSADAISIPGYKFEHKCRATGRGGGVGFFIKQNLTYCLFQLPHACSSHTTYESIFIYLLTEDGSRFMAGSIYRPPGSCMDIFNQEWETLLSTIQSKAKDIFILGDFNIDLLKSQDHKLTGIFYNMMTSFHFLPTISQPTRITISSATLIDNIFANCISKIVKPTILVEDLSDHLPVLVWADLTPMRFVSSTNNSTRIFDSYSKERFKSILTECDWSSTIEACDNHDVSSAYELFNANVTTAYNLAFPIKPKRVRQTIYRKPWMTAALLKSSRNKNKLYLAFINNPTPANKNKYTAYKNRFKSLCKKSEKTFYSAEFTRYSKDLKNTWITIKSILKTKQHDSLIKCVNSNGSKITDNAHMAELFNNYFTNIADEVVTKIPSPSKPATFYLDPPSLTSFAIYPTSAEEVLALSTTLKTTQSTGPDDLNPSVMKPLLSIIAKPLAEIINCSLTTGIVPGPMKIAKVTPIYKQGNSEEVTNYRPISILPYFSKLLEKVMYVRLYNYIVTRGILYESQHGFQHGHSTLMSLLSVHDTIAAAIDRKEYAIGIFLDVAKAFDSVNHDILLLKLENLGIRGVTLAWFRSYLTGRYQQVKCNNHLSSLNLVKHGVPQGSILGPLLFLLFVNDLPNASSALHFYLFADDTNIFASNKSYEKLVQQLNLELVHVNDWFAANKLSLNIKKTNYILFSSHRKKLPLTEIPLLINNTPVPRVTSIKFLGVLIDSHLTWNDHIHSI